MAAAAPSCAPGEAGGDAAWELSAVAALVARYRAALRLRHIKCNAVLVHGVTRSPPTCCVRIRELVLCVSAAQATQVFPNVWGGASIADVSPGRFLARGSKLGTL